MMINPTFSDFLRVAIEPSLPDQSLKMDMDTSSDKSMSMFYIYFNPTMQKNTETFRLHQTNTSCPLTITGWWFQTFGLVSIIKKGCHPSHWRTPSFFRGVGQPPTRLIFIDMVKLYHCITQQMSTYIYIFHSYHWQFFVHNIWDNLAHWRTHTLWLKPPTRYPLVN